MTLEEHSLIEQNELFRDMDIKSVDYILNECLILTVFNGEKLLEIGQKNSSLYLILEGELHVYLDSRDLTEHAVLVAGQCVGELSLIDGGNASALVIAAKDTRVLAVPHHHVWSLVDNSHGFSRNLLSVLAGRIRNNNLLLVTTHDHSLEFEVAANLDTLTGLHNRSWMDEAFPRMILRCERSQAPLCMLIADIDHYETFSHAYGRLAGEDVLKAVSKLMAEKLRPQDLLVYLGGDKFSVLLPDTLQDGAVKIAERLRETIAMSSLQNSAIEAQLTTVVSPVNQDMSITISVGIAAMEQGDLQDSIFSRAHMALYQAKAAGRNQVKVAESTDEGAPL